MADWWVSHALRMLWSSQSNQEHGACTICCIALHMCDLIALKQPSILLHHVVPCSNRGACSGVDWICMIIFQCRVAFLFVCCKLCLTLANLKVLGPIDVNQSLNRSVMKSLQSLICLAALLKDSSESFSRPRLQMIDFRVWKRSRVISIRAF